MRRPSRIKRDFGHQKEDFFRDAHGFEPAIFKKGRNHLAWKHTSTNRMLTYLLIGINVLVSLIGFSKMNSMGDSMFFF